MAYNQIGPYQKGVWLVTPSGGTDNGAYLVTKPNLPPPGKGYQYYYLGSTLQQAQARYGQALQALMSPGSPSIPSPDPSQVQQAFSKGRAVVQKPQSSVGNWITQNWPFALGGFKGSSDTFPFLMPEDPAPDLTLPGDSSAPGAGGGRVRPGGQAAGTAGGAAAGAGTAVKVAGLAGAGLALTDAKDFFNLISWLFHPQNWLRAVEFLTGMFFIYLGLRGTFRTFRNSAPGPTPLITKAMRVTPVGRAIDTSKGVSAGRRRARYDSGYRKGYRNERTKKTGSRNS